MREKNRWETGEAVSSVGTDIKISRSSLFNDKVTHPCPGYQQRQRVIHLQTVKSVESWVASEGLTLAEFSYKGEKCRFCNTAFANKYLNYV